MIANELHYKNMEAILAIHTGAQLDSLTYPTSPRPQLYTDPGTHTEHLLLKHLPTSGACWIPRVNPPRSPALRHRFYPPQVPARIGSAQALQTRTCPGDDQALLRVPWQYLTGELRGSLVGHPLEKVQARVIGFVVVHGSRLQGCHKTVIIFTQKIQWRHGDVGLEGPVAPNLRYGT